MVISRIREGNRVVRRVVKVYERVGNGWSEIYSYGEEDFSRVEESRILNERIPQRLLLEDPVREWRRRVGDLKALSLAVHDVKSSYESVELCMKAHYKITPTLR